ncbi:hypothetical protein Focb16_v006235 [Fusarium oxysporum f. sp. cubense]|uniref:Uncharacterized protein n=1 Tax=Fusarium oxysporum f. sp. cubense TaxID=61366 RepID=A0A559LKV2_FUSOC|nr:hypothetical protein Focb16_v006235 [Fusarium oxysporum f. sp. cubense]
MEQDGDLDALDRLKQGEGFPQELVEESASAVKHDALENQTVIAEFRSLLDEENALAVILDDLSKPKKGEGLHLKLVVVTRSDRNGLVWSGMRGQTKPYQMLT